MGVSVGEVEAVLTARDNMSPAVVAAAEKLQQLNAALLAVANNGSPELASSLKSLQAAIADAELEFERAQTQAATMAAAMVSAAASAGSAAPSIGAAGQATAAAGQAAQTSAAQYASLAAITATATAAAQAQAAATVNQAAAVTAAGQAAAQGAAAQAAAAATTGQSLSTLDGIATRMIERLLILAAVRGTYQFVTGLFEAADTLVRLNEQTDLTIGKLQQLQYTATNTGVPFATVTTAVDTFQKKLGEAKATTGDALASIGLSFEQLFPMSADQRLDTVIAAIAALPTHLQRTAAEAKLFGTDAIDPLIQKYIELGKAAVDNGAILEDASIKSMANTVKMYRDLSSQVGVTTASIIDSWQKMVAVIMAPLYGAGSASNLAKAVSDLAKNTSISGLGSLNYLSPIGAAGAAADAYLSYQTPAKPPLNREEFRQMRLATGGSDPYPGPGGGAESVPDAGGGTGGPLTGKAYVDSLVEQAKAVHVLTGEQNEELAVLKSLGLLDAEHASRISANADGTNFTTEQLKEYIKTQKDATASSAAYAKSEAALQEILNKAASDLSRLQGDNKSTGSLSERISAIDDETYAAQVAAQNRIGYTKDEWEAEYALYLVGEQKKQNLIDSSSKIEDEILSKAAQDREAIEAKSAAGSLDARVAAIDDEVYHEQTVAQRRLNNDEESWRTDYAIWQTGEARKAALIDDYNQKELTTEKKERDNLLAAQTVSDAVGLQKTLDNIDAKTKAEIDALDTSKLRMADYFTQLNLLQDTNNQLRVNAQLNFQRDMDKAIVEVAKQDQDVLINLYLVGETRELAINEEKRQAKLDTLKLEGKDTADMIAAENKLYDDQAKAIIVTNDPILKAYRDLNTDMRLELATTWEQAITGTKSFGQAFEDTLTHDMATPFARILAGMLADFEQILFNPLLNALRTLAGSLESTLVNSLVSGATGGTVAGGAGNSIYSSVLNSGVSYGSKAALGYLLGGASATGAFVGPLEAVAGGGAATSAFEVPASLAANAAPSGLAAAGGTLAGYAGIGVGAWMLGQYLGYQTESKPEGALMGAGAGAAEGAAVGSVVPGIGTAIGAGIGAIAGAIAGWREAGHLYDEVKTDESDLQAQFGSSAKEIDAVSQAYALMGYSGDQAQAALHKVWDAQTPTEFYAAMAPVANALQIFQQNQLDLAAATTDEWGRASDAMERIIALNDTSGGNTDAVNAFIASQSTVVTGAVANVTAGLPLDQWDKMYNVIQSAGGDPGDPNAAIDPNAQNQRTILQGKIDDAQAAYDKLVAAGKSTQAQLDAAKSKVQVAQSNYDTAYPDVDSAVALQQAEAQRNAPALKGIGTQVVGAYALEASTPGKSSYDALKDNSAAITNLQHAYRDLGLDVSDTALKAIFLQNTILTANPNLLAGVDGLGKEMTGLVNIGQETTDSFAAQQRTGEQMYAQLQDAAFQAGGTTKDALLPMQDYLHDAEAAAIKLNKPLDDLTQEMINQSKDLGIWQDQVKPPATVQDAIDKLVASVQALIDKLNGIPSNPYPTPPATPPVTPPGDTGNGGPPENDPNNPQIYGGYTGPVLMAGGGFGTVTSPTLFIAGEAGPEQFAFSGTNTTFLAGDFPPNGVTTDGGGGLFPSYPGLVDPGTASGGIGFPVTPPAVPTVTLPPIVGPGTGTSSQPYNDIYASANIFLQAAGVIQSAAQLMYNSVKVAPAPSAPLPVPSGPAIGLPAPSPPQIWTANGTLPNNTYVSLYPTISLTSDDVKDPARVIDIIKNELATNQNMLLTAIQLAAVKAVRDSWGT